MADWFLCENLKNITPDSEFELSKSESDHLFRTLRARNGEVIEVFDGAGVVAEAEVVTKGVLKLRDFLISRPRRTSIRLLTALPRKNRLDFMLNQLAQTGVAIITPLICERSVATPQESKERWRNHLIEGCKQSRNPYIPQLEEPQKLTEVLQNFNEPAFFGAVSASFSATPQWPQTADRVSFFVGPEGGFTTQEEELMLQAQVQGISLGDYILRLETAAITGVWYLNKLAAVNHGNSEV